MRIRRSHIVSVILFVFLSWNLLTFYVLSNKPMGKVAEGMSQEVLSSRLVQLEKDISQQLHENEKLLKQLRQLRENAEGKCRYRPSGDKFPIIVSQDCGHQPTADVIQQYVKKQYITHIQHPDHANINLPWPQKKFVGYYKIARHYKWALNQVFKVFNYSTVLIVEDDLDISPDFYEYFAATHDLLRSDPLLWCVSAWNDNGKNGMVSDDSELLYRSDFFPGLGWMIERSTWEELEPKWPETFWDDWMRHPEQRKNRECIRPEICRTSTFGKKGVSKGLYFEKHLKFIKLNTKFVPFTKMDLSHLEKEKYDTEFVNKVYNTQLLTVDEVLSMAKTEYSTVRVQYSTKDEFKTFAKKLGIMDDFKAGVPRAAYRGVVSFMLKGRRIYLSPPPTWSGYDPKWT
ncbi:alpha-1,3-mannosyl-glycoprotein 2-beta-N-acetylglucosaminyltransferase-like [Gigantopelta aegis]|uniref:alpha-1,3-mannosyl-glycoprotein 2-beta-N-acetylglucosaminyltransferase-like n=1 Tax=Gigantopelta aegis TaxID=1735272 RepID=UPI001B888507|nr:alpha-1,3-mannosyl-glycoprotein 2-beta-N-acetylglucosaminyltransferase-like [Gigantopelta aegis]